MEATQLTWLSVFLFLVASIICIVREVMHSSETADLRKKISDEQFSLDMKEIEINQLKERIVNYEAEIKIISDENKKLKSDELKITDMYQSALIDFVKLKQKYERPRDAKGLFIKKVK